jgi:hypothetical protein
MMTIVQNIFTHFSVLLVALLQCSSAVLTLLGVLMVVLGVYPLGSRSTHSQARGPAILVVVGVPLAITWGIVLLIVNMTAAKDVLVLSSKEMVQLGGHAALLGLLLIAVGVGLIPTLARAFSKNEKVVFLPVTAFLLGGLTLLSGVSSAALGWVA